MWEKHNLPNPSFNSTLSFQNIVGFFLFLVFCFLPSSYLNPSWSMGFIKWLIKTYCPRIKWNLFLGYLNLIQWLSKNCDLFKSCHFVKTHNCSGLVNYEYFLKFRYSIKYFNMNHVYGRGTRLWSCWLNQNNNQMCERASENERNREKKKTDKKFPSVN